MTDEIKPNEADKLNDDLEEIKAEVIGQKPNPLPKKKDISERIKEWNNKPEIKERGIKAEKKWKWNLYKFLAVIGTIALIGLVASIGVYVWFDINGSHRNPISL